MLGDVGLQDKMSAFQLLLLKNGDVYHALEPLRVSTVVQ